MWILVLGRTFVEGFEVSSRSWLRAVTGIERGSDIYIRVVMLMLWGENDFHGIDDIAPYLLREVN